MPGPGHFGGQEDWARTNSRGIGFGSSKRGNLDNSRPGEKIPGPGNYTLQDGTLSSAPAYSMGSKKANKYND